MFVVHTIEGGEFALQEGIYHVREVGWWGARGSDPPIINCRLNTFMKLTISVHAREMWDARFVNLIDMIRRILKVLDVFMFGALLLAWAEDT